MGLESLIDKIFEKDEIINYFFENTSTLNIVIDLDGNIVMVNSAWKRFLNYEKEEMVGKHFKEFLHPDDVDEAMEISFNNFSNKTFLKDAYGEDLTGMEQFTNRYKVKNDGYATIKWSKHALYYNNFVLCHAEFGGYETD